MYDPILSKLALQAIKNLLPEIVLAVQRNTLFSKQEQDTLSTIKASQVMSRLTILITLIILFEGVNCFLLHWSSSPQTPSPNLKDFEDLLKAHPQVFHGARTARCLAKHWQSLRQYTLLPDQSVHPLPKDNNILNFLDAEANINDGELFEEKDELLDHELTATDRRYENFFKRN